MKKPYPTVLRSALAAVLFGATALQAHAIIITPTDSRYEPGGVRYNFVVSDWSSGTAGMPSPCVDLDYAKTTCNVSLYVFRSYGSIVVVGFSGTTWHVPIRRGSETMANLLWDLEGKGFRIPHSGSILVPNSSVKDGICISFGFAKVGPNLGGGVGPFGPCTRVVEPMLQCAIKGDTTIDHKNLPDNALNGAQASTQLSLQCRGPASVTVSASRTNTYGVRLRDDDSLYSKITVNGKDATAGINVAVADGLNTPLDITSTLSTRGTVTPGPFSGSTVITVSPP
ncbi:hypothetical protein [Pseudomonas putida]|uniref:MrpH family fimbial adhesin n=1 Tax=Pseudomonas putida TaxID=303 RepID=UPI0023659025|nr:hypothetical protein [Pseudomonas putida]MDD2047819.1 hypothetical protein [Pseudomonas putida]